MCSGSKSHWIRSPNSSPRLTRPSHRRENASKIVVLQRAFPIHRRGMGEARISVFSVPTQFEKLASSRRDAIHRRAEETPQLHDVAPTDSPITKSMLLHATVVLSTSNTLSDTTFISSLTQLAVNTKPLDVEHNGIHAVRCTTNVDPLHNSGIARSDGPLNHQMWIHVTSSRPGHGSS